MKFTQFMLLMLVSGCIQSTNSHSNDATLWGREQITDPTFAAAYRVLNNRCINCHSGRHAHWSDYQTVEEWYAFENGEALVVPNNLQASSIINRLTLWGNVGGMPEGEANLTDEEYTALRTWIQSL
jgi:uncharacterized membrane protein